MEKEVYENASEVLNKEVVKNEPPLELVELDSFEIALCQACGDPCVTY